MRWSRERSSLMKIQFTTKQKDPTVQHGVKIPYAPAKRMAAQWRWYLILLIVASPLLYFLIRMGLSFIIVTAQGYISLDKIEVNCTISGMVDSIEVEPGQEVLTGVVIATLSNPELMAQKRQAEAELASLNVDQPPRSNAKAQLLKNQVDLARRVLASQRDDYRTMAFLFEQGAATLAELTTARERRDKAESEYHNALYERKYYEDDFQRQATVVRPEEYKEKNTLNGSTENHRGAVIPHAPNHTLRWKGFGNSGRTGGSPGAGGAHCDDRPL